MRLLVFFATIGTVSCLLQRPDSRAMKDYSVPSKPLANIASLSAGMLHTCALSTTGKVWCWGDWKRYDDPTRFKATYVLSPESQPIDNIVQISAGSFDTCAVTTSGNLQCWGKYLFMRWDDKGTYARPIHTADDKLLGNIAQVSVSFDINCVLTTSGQVKCWEKDSIGKSAPIDVMIAAKTPLNNIVQISVGYDHACALTKDGHVKCWGDGKTGQLGNGANKASPYAVDVITATSKLLDNVVQISAGSNHTCALTKSGHVKCWGDGEIGQLGNGDSKNSNIAVDVTTASGKLANIKQVGAGVTHTCALTNTGHVKCWGAGKAGQMGTGIDGVDEGRKSPVDVTSVASSGHELLANITQIAVGGVHSCALTNTGQVKCWGSGKEGQLGYGTDFDGRSRNRYRAVHVRY